MSNIAVPSTIPTLYRTLASLDSYEPSPETNRLFSRLVTLVLSDNGSIDLEETAINNLRTICATAEYRLERHWSGRIVESDDPQTTLAQFPYIENYQRLAVMEHEGLVETGASVPDHTAFVGGGPLPLSALYLANHGWSGTIIDHNPEAVALARALISALETDLSIHLADGAVVDYADYDLIHVAALVGGTEGMAYSIRSRRQQTPDRFYLLVGPRSSSTPLSTASRRYVRPFSSSPDGSTARRYYQLGGVLSGVSDSTAAYSHSS
ncbi:nicotianamine synthase family protein [Halocatena marina]|uniref:Nicotianamine synthase family protein n=1 Tax=Halocatena marina TaxID=2934937 RepID=A0ABD5YSQ8_9EURY